MDTKELQLHRDDLSSGLELETGKHFKIKFGEPLGEIHLLVHDEKNVNPVHDTPFTITGPHGMNASGNTGPNGEIDVVDPQVPIDHYTLKILDHEFPVESRLPGLDPVTVRVPGFPKHEDPPPPPPPPPGPHAEGPDCEKSVEKPPQWLLDTPCRDLYRSDARWIAAWLNSQGKIKLLEGAKFTFKHDAENKCVIKGPKTSDHVTIDSMVDGVQYYYMNGYAKPDYGPKEKLVRNLHNLDWRNLVNVWKLAVYLRDLWGATEIIHLGIGSTAHPDQVNCHNEGRAVDFVGAKGKVPDSYPDSAIRGFEYEFAVPRDWHKSEKKLSGKGYRLEKNLTSDDLNKRAAAFFFLDVYKYATRELQTISYDGRCDYHRDTGEKKGSDPNANFKELGQDSGFIIHPDHGDSDLSAAHWDHFHFQIKRTFGKEPNPPE